MEQVLQRGACPLCPCSQLLQTSRSPSLSGRFTSPHRALGASRTVSRRGRVGACTCLWGRQREKKQDDTNETEAPVDDSPGYLVEKSNAVYQEVVLLLLQLDLDAQLQRALNIENYTEAQAVRARREKVDQGLIRLQEAKSAASGSDETAGEGQTDLALQCVRMQSELQTAIDNEEYGDAVRLRDALQQVQAKAEAAANRTSQDRELLQQQKTYSLGQRVMHTTHNYRGVICGWDGNCMEQSSWQEGASISSLSAGKEQPFYHVLVDARDWENPWEPGITYVPQELLNAPQDPKTWVTEHGTDEFEHVFTMQLFLGHDERGDMIPVRQLRDKYLQPRRDIQPPEGSEGPQE